MTSATPAGESETTLDISGLSKVEIYEGQKENLITGTCKLQRMNMFM